MTNKNSFDTTKTVTIKEKNAAIKHIAAILNNKHVIELIKKLKANEQEIEQYAADFLVYANEQKQPDNHLWLTSITRNTTTGKINVSKYINKSKKFESFKIKANINLGFLGKLKYDVKLQHFIFSDDNSEDDIYVYLQNMLNAIKNNKKIPSLFLIGDYETSKTELMCALTNHFASLNYKVAYIDVNDLDDYSKKVFSNDINIDISLLTQELIEQDVLFIDELGYKQLNNWFLETILVKVLEKRYLDKKLTFFGSYYGINKITYRITKEKLSNESNNWPPLFKKFLFLIDKMSDEKIWTEKYEIKEN
ncbi:ATP-binding protein [Mycoplasma leonicaptivi]|uniref:ATP-binding protein n=1 Tax=Mycoplasma leonicaptivi TaxID=36742 RepID=UPI0004849B0D|nr:ATP-binding protein [Mycoplasma leonicaptivi]